LPPEDIIFGQRVSDEKLQLARELRRAMTPEERILWKHLRAHRLQGLHFRRQQVIDGFVVDFFCFDAALVVEVDGGVHRAQAAYDAERDLVLKKRGLRVVRITNEDVRCNLAGVLARIAEAAAPCPSPEGQANRRQPPEPGVGASPSRRPPKGGPMPDSLDPRRAMVELGRLIYARQLSDSAGGNMSVRSGGRIYITPRYMGSRHRWSIAPEMITVLDAASQRVVEGPGDISREARAHLAIYAAFPEAGAVIHAHPQYVQVFACANRPLPAVAEYTQKYGTIPCIPPSQAHSQALADAVVEALRPRQAELAEHGLAVLLPYHGIIVAGRDLDDAYDTLERMEVNARCALWGALLARL